MKNNHFEKQSILDGGKFSKIFLSDQKKQEILHLLRKLQELQPLIEAKEYGAAENKSNHIWASYKQNLKNHPQLLRMRAQILIHKIFLAQKEVSDNINLTESLVIWKRILFYIKEANKSLNDAKKKAIEASDRFHTVEDYLGESITSFLSKVEADKGELTKLEQTNVKDDDTHISDDKSEFSKENVSENVAQTKPTKKEIENKYKELIASLNDALEDLNKNWSSNNSLNELNRTVIEHLKTEITNAKNEMDASLHAVSWDNIVIAFFGETNAGKSTIIETFRILFDSKRPKNKDGLIVGDGQSDFTKDYNEYPLEIEGKRFTLIDVPGIEGKEIEYSDKIQTALRKAHCVFYVQGHNKKPDEETAKKIKEYLGDWVNVYSIQNIRGGVSNYDEEEERKELLTEYVRKNETLIKETFTKILGKEVYKGNIPLQALLAMCAKATFAPQREDLIKNQKKLLGYFGSADGVLRFSQFQTIINLVKTKSENFLDEIIEANKQKQVSIARNIAKRLEHILESKQNEFKILKDAIRNYKDSSMQAFSSMRSFLNNRMPNIIDNEFNSLKNDINKAIEYEDPDVIKHSVKTIVRDFPETLSAALHKETQNATQNLNSKLIKASKKIEGVYKTSSLNIPQIDITFSFDVSYDLKDLDVTLEDIGKTVSTIGGALVAGGSFGSLFGPLGTIIGTGIGGICGIFARAWQGKYDDGGRPEVRSNIANTLGREREKIKDSIRDKTTNLITKINDEERKTKKRIDNLARNINAISDTIDDVVNDMERHINKLKTKKYGKV